MSRNCFPERNPFLIIGLFLVSIILLISLRLKISIHSFQDFLFRFFILDFRVDLESRVYIRMTDPFLDPLDIESFMDQNGNT